MGDEATTLIKDLISPQQISSQLANRLHDTSVTHRMTIDISVNNFRQMEAARKSGMNARVESSGSSIGACSTSAPDAELR